MKRLPYGISDFPRLISENYYYVDKTSYIELLENQPNFLFLLRPRRFGKSLFMAMLEAYYSVDYRERFDELFSGLYIGHHPTPSRNTYLALRFNFSEVTSNPDEVERSFKAYCCMVIKDFIIGHEVLLGSDVWKVVKEDDTDPSAMLSALNRYITRTGCPHIYLLIDEYDNFTNTLLATYGTERYRRTTHGEGFIREFFNTIKAATTGPGAAIDRLFITGVSPVTMDDVTSGFNIGTNISLLPQFNGIIGFSTEEVRRMVGYYQSEGALPADVTVDGLLEEMKPWYDNYCFSEDASDEHMFNSDMTLYFLNSYLQQQRPPRQMVDNNIRTDYGKLRHLVQVDRRLGKNTSVIQQLVSEGRVTASIATSFPAERMVETDNFKSLLFYLGMLSIQGTDFGDTILGIPNLTVREQLYTYLVEAYRDASLFTLDLSVLSDLVKGMALHGEWEPVFRYFAAELERQSAVREFIEGEAHVKGFLLAYLGLTRGYTILPEHESSKGYADFYMMPDLQRQPDIAYSYLVEVKYARRDATPAELAALKEQAASQLSRYAADEKVQKSKGHTTLRLLILLFRGWELEAEEVV
ncbi:ATP-binding protein [Mediterranea massiliensis]|uniref:ATP-binding protein n=1 Tax=Mediterranea massiliensis TaxID=1841865 RepID=UPI00266BE068|nr:ATP-binding protein [Mediterranea massiliensis]